MGKFAAGSEELTVNYHSLNYLREG